MSEGENLRVKHEKALARALIASSASIHSFPECLRSPLKGESCVHGRDSKERRLNNADKTFLIIRSAIARTLRSALETVSAVFSALDFVACVMGLSDAECQMIDFCVSSWKLRICHVSSSVFVLDGSINARRVLLR